MSVTAVVLSAKSYVVPQPVDEVLVHVSTIRNAQDLLIARFDAVRKVKTSHWFWLDDDDLLPDDVMDVLAECVAADAPLAYTNEIIRTLNGDKLLQSGPYTQAAHLRNSKLVHHLALYQTRASVEAIGKLPRGHYCPEMLLSWEVAKRGAVYVPRIGYIWNKRNGMHKWPSTVFSQGRAHLWCETNP